MNRKEVIGIIALFLVGLIYYCSMSSNEHNSQRESSIMSSLQYLTNVEEIEWVDVDGNDVYIGFRSYPEDLKFICQGAALRGNKVTNFGVHVWAVNSTQYSKGWRPGDGSYYYSVTARYGKIE